MASVEAVVEAVVSVAVVVVEVASEAVVVASEVGIVVVVSSMAEEEGLEGGSEAPEAMASEVSGVAGDIGVIEASGVTETLDEASGVGGEVVAG